LLPRNPTLPSLHPSQNGCSLVLEVYLPPRAGCFAKADSHLITFSTFPRRHVHLLTPRLPPQSREGTVIGGRSSSAVATACPPTKDESFPSRVGRAQKPCLPERLTISQVSAVSFELDACPGTDPGKCCAFQWFRFRDCKIVVLVDLLRD
jgi:hypothetical protein